MLERVKSWITHKSLAAPDVDLAALFGVTPGYSASAGAALAVPAVQAAVRLISEAVASLDIKIVRRVGGVDVEASEHPVAALFAGGPNDWTDTFTFIRDLTAGALISDKGSLAFVNRVGAGRIRELVRYEPAHFTVDYSGDGRMEPAFRINNAQVASENVVHLRSAFLRCPLSLASDAIGAAKEMERHAANLFKNGARPSGVLALKGRVGPDGVRKVRESWQAAHGGGKSGGTAILEGEAEYTSLALTSADAQFLEMRKFQIIEICRAFRVPPSMIYDLDRATWSNSEQMGREFLVYTLEPWLKALEGALRRALFSPEERAEYRVVFDRDDLTRADLTDRASAISSLISSRVLNPNEARSWLDLAPRAGGEQYANPNTGSNQPGATAPEAEETE